MNVLLVYPRWNYPTFGEVQEPLGIIYVGAALKAAGHNVRLIDLTVEDIEEVDRAVAWADMAGMSSPTALYGRACKILDRIKQERPELPIVMGGPHATVMAEEVVARGFDAVVVGEGEHTAVELARALDNGDPLYEVPGVVAKKGDEIITGPMRAFEPDLDSMPDPDRTLIRYDDYFGLNLEHMGLMATRGCPWNCLFCKPMQDKLFGRKVRRRGVKRIVAEMAWIEKHLHKSIYLFRDDTLLMAGPEWFVELGDELKSQGLGHAQWSCQARVDQIERPMLEKMKQCGLQGIAFGVESGSQKVLDFYRKGIKVEQTVAAFDLCHEMGIGTHAFIMLGAPVETKEDLEATVRLVERIKTESVSVSISTPAPGTDFYDQARESGVFNIRSPEESDYHYNREPIKLPHLTTNDLAEAEKAILDLVPETFFIEQLKSRAEKLVG